MKRFFFIVLLIAFAVSAEAADVGVSVSIGQPGFYGQIDIGDFPRPQVIFPKPVLIAPVPVGVAPPPPVYVHIPPGHEKKWNKHCHKYNACDRPVYFVRDRWYNETYVPAYQARHGHPGGPDNHHDKHHGKDKHRDKHKNHHKDHHKGHGKDKHRG
ncbi:MAG: hypothetical protein ABFD75_15320 [Smithella sp.]